MTGREISKQEFKELYFKYGGEGTGWTADYWKQFYEELECKRIVFIEPESEEENRLFIVGDSEELRMFLLTEEAEERFFGN
jgi:hypothetical protein